MHSEKIHQHLLEYKVNKIIRLIKKIRKTLEEEGLDHRQLPQLINRSLDLTHEGKSSKSCFSSVFEEFAVASLTENSDKFTASTLLALSQTYKNLQNSLQDQSPFLQLKQLSTSKQTKQTSVKLQQNFPIIQMKKERSNVVKLQEGVDSEPINTFSQSQMELQRLKKELVQKRREVKRLRDQFEAKKKTETVQTRQAKKEKKNKRR